MAWHPERREQPLVETRGEALVLEHSTAELDGCVRTAEGDPWDTAPTPTGGLHDEDVG